MRGKWGTYGSKGFARERDKVIRDFCMRRMDLSERDESTGVKRIDRAFGRAKMLVKNTAARLLASSRFSPSGQFE